MLADVTVVMPAMNRAHLIGRALDSVSAQSLAPRSVVVIDDASTDDTVAVAKRHGADVIELDVNGGSGPARNRGIEAATTRWIAFLDSDDEWEPHHLERLMARAAEGHVLVTAPGLANGTRLIGNAFAHELGLTPLRALVADVICTSGTMADRDALIEAGLFRDLRRAQDMDMWVRLLEKGSGLALGEPSVFYRLHDQQAVNDKVLMRECVDRIVRDSATRPWFRRGDGDRVLATRRWDFAREAQAARRPTEVARHLGWLAVHPHTWSSLLFELRQRRWARARARAWNK